MSVIRRRSLIAGAGVAGILRANAAPLLPAVRPMTPRIFKGTTTKLRAVALYSVNWPYWTDFWGQWNWAGFIQPALQAAAAAGANAVKVTLPNISDDGNAYPPAAQVQAQLQQFCAYCATLGMAVILQLGFQPVYQFGTDGTNATRVNLGIAAAVQAAGFGAAIPNISYIDAMNEWDLSGMNTPLTMSQWLSYWQAIKAVAPNKPVTLSSSSPNAATTLLGTVPVDLADYHYYNLPAGTWSNSAWSSAVAPMRAATYYPGIEFCGETGLPLTSSATAAFSAAQQTAWFTGATIMATDSHSAGACVWPLCDTYGINPALLYTGAYWGMCPMPVGGVAPTPRTAISVPFQTWPAQL